MINHIIWLTRFKAKKLHSATLKIMYAKYFILSRLLNSLFKKEIQTKKKPKKPTSPFLKILSPRLFTEYFLHFCLDLGWPTLLIRTLPVLALKILWSGEFIHLGKFFHSGHSPYSVKPGFSSIKTKLHSVIISFIKRLLYFLFLSKIWVQKH